MIRVINNWFIPGLMDYITLNNDFYELDKLLMHDQQMIYWLKQFARHTPFADSYKIFSEGAAIARAQDRNGKHWKHHPVYKIQQDLYERKLQKEKVGDFSKLFV